MINQDAVKEAKEILSKNINLNTYYKDFVDSTGDLLATSLVCCPLHDDTTPSFKYYEDTNTFYCFGCGKGGRYKGTVVDLHYWLNKKYNENYTYVKALLDLSKYYKVKIPSLFDISSLNPLEKALRGFEKPKVIYKDNMKTPLKVVMAEIEKKVSMLKSIDFNLYIDYIKKLDHIYMIHDNCYDELIDLLKELGGVLVDCKKEVL